MDYLMFEQGLDVKEFSEKLLDTTMYSSEVTTDKDTVLIALKKESESDGEN